MNKIKKFVVVVLAAMMMISAFTTVSVGADVPTVTFATHPYKFQMGWRSGYNPVMYGNTFRCINTSGGTTYEYYVKGLDGSQIRMYCLDHRLSSPPLADIMCQGSVESYYGVKAAKYLNGIAAFDQFGYKNSVIAKLPNKRHRESLTQLALWYASAEIVRGGATSVTFNNLLYRMDARTMLEAYGLGLAGLQGTWMSYKGLTWADVTGLTEDQLYELIIDDYVTHLDAYIQNPTCVTSYADTVYTSVWTGLSNQQPMLVIGNDTFYPQTYSGVVYAYKSDELGNMVKGVTFGIYSNAACTNRISTMTTDANGYAEATVSLYQNMNTTKTVYVKEISAPANYRMDSTVYTCVVKSYNKDIAEISSTSRWTRVGGANATIVNTATGYLTLTKEDNAGNTLGAGVVFGLYTDAACTNKIDEFTTDENGVAKSAVHDRGTYYLKELSVPDSFHVVISSDVTEISLGIGENTLTVENDLMGQISVIKKDDAGTILGDGYSFGIYSDSSCTNLVETITTDTTGIATSSYLTPGETYYIKEIGLPTGAAEIYSTNNTVYPVTVVSGETVTQVVVNNRKTILSVTKKDDAGNTLGAGYVFGIYADANCTTEITRMTTDTTGVATSGYLDTATYYVKELALPDTDTLHVLNTTVYTVAGVPGETTLVNGGAIINNSVTSSGKVTKTSEDGVIKGLKFRLYGTSDTGLAVDVTATTDANGVALFADIPIGTYTIEEIDLPEYYQNPEPQTFRIVLGEITEVAFENLLDPGTIVIKKVDVWTDTLVPGAEIALYQYVDGAYVELDREVTDENGRVYFAAPVPGVYYYHETAAPMGYYLDEDYYEILVDEDLNVTGHVTFQEAPFGTAVLKKVNEKGEYLPGATLAVFDAEGNELFRDVTDEFGRIYFAAPAAGEYYFTEIEAPLGYLLNEEEHHFTLDVDGNISGTRRMIDKEERLPATGDASFIVYGGMAISSLASLILLGKRKKKEDE